MSENCVLDNQARELDLQELERTCQSLGLPRQNPIPRHLRRRTTSYRRRRKPRRRRDPKKPVRTVFPVLIINYPTCPHESVLHLHTCLISCICATQAFRKLCTHVWHAKRMHMQPLWGSMVPLRRCDRGLAAAVKVSILLFT